MHWRDGWHSLHLGLRLGILALPQNRLLLSRSSSHKINLWKRKCCAVLMLYKRATIDNHLLIIVMSSIRCSCTGMHAYSILKSGQPLLLKILARPSSVRPHYLVQKKKLPLFPKLMSPMKSSVDAPRTIENFPPSPPSWTRAPVHHHQRLK